MDMIYNDYYETVDNEMSDSNLGSRRNKNVRNHTWVIHGIMNEALRTKNGEVDLLIQDFRQCFDSLSVDTVINHLYDSGIRDNKLNLIDKADRSSTIKVNTPVGSTETNEIRDSVLQGEKLGSLKCSNSIDKTGKQCLEDGTDLYL